MAWVILFVAGLLERVWSLLLNGLFDHYEAAPGLASASRFVRTKSTEQCA